MDTPLLVDAIVRQTMVLIAQLSTASGRRSPLSHVADRVFLDLVEELERQRLGKKVIADMFGLALRSYQQKVRRLTESATDQGQTLWAAVFAFLQERGVSTKVDILRRFNSDDETSVRGILTDLVDSGLVFRSGRGDATLFRATGDEDWQRAGADWNDRAMLAWVSIYRDGPMTADELAERLGVDPISVEALLAPLVADGRVRSEGEGAAQRFHTESCEIPLGAPVGFEAGIIDHFRAVSSALAAKVRTGARRSGKEDATGGSTFTFEIAPHHALEQEVLATLQRLRLELISLWERVAEENRRNPLGDSGYRVTTYVGQYVEAQESHEVDD
jgi:predicted transcriptional regulator